MSEDLKDFLFIVAVAVVAFCAIRLLVWFIPHHPIASVFIAAVGLAAWVFAFAGGGD